MDLFLQTTADALLESPESSNAVAPKATQLDESLGDQEVSGLLSEHQILSGWQLRMVETQLQGNASDLLQGIPSCKTGPQRCFYP